MPYAMLQDMTQCIACKACQVACKEWNELPATTTRNEGDYENPRDLGPTTWTRVQFLEQPDAAGDAGWLFFKQQCMHCADAPCVKACPTGALKNDARGFVSFERELCNGCGYCADFCPYGAARVDVDSVWTGGAKAAKCTMCEDRITNGQEPACAKACPTAAIRFGERDELVTAGEERVAALQAQGRTSANLYGKKERLGVLYVLPEPPSTYKALAHGPGGSRFVASFWQTVLQPAGAIGLALGVVGLAVNYVTVSRRAGAGKEEP